MSRLAPRLSTQFAALALLCVVPGCRDSHPAAAPPAASATPAARPAPAPAAQPAPAPAAAASPPVHDPHSQSDPTRVAVHHLGLALTVDFPERRLRGHVVLVLDRRDRSAPLRLDTSEELEVTGVDVGSLPASLRDRSAPVAELADAGWRPAEFRREPVTPDLGRALVVDLPEAVDLVRVHYRTGAGASGLHWLAPAQTGSRRHPFLYTQSEAIQARSWIPCQDSPGVRITYDAALAVAAPADDPAPDALFAVMAAGESSRGDDGRFRFVTREPIPSYLVSLAVGELARREVGPRSAVWAEPGVLDRAAEELAGTEKLVAAAEAIAGPYPWGRYDLLILPPAYPLGGMENPRLNFVSPTVLAGDRSLVGLIAHELAHSWAGDLVTNATWGDTWLNEGITTYLENRIIESVYGRQRAELEALLGYQALERTLAATADHPEQQRLAVDPDQNRPGAGFSAIGYQKGALFLRALERSHGRPVFDRFLHRWFSEHAFRSVTTAEFVAFAHRELPARPAAGPPVDIDRWLHRPGLPEAAPRPSSEAYQRVVAAAGEFAAGRLSAADLAGRGFSPIELEHLLHALPADLGLRELTALDRSFHFTASHNSEILDAWLLLTVGKRYRPATERMRAFLTEVGRFKLVAPLYERLNTTAEGRRWARKVYREARSGYHVWLRHHLDQLLGWSS